MESQIVFDETSPSVSEYLHLRELAGWCPMPEAVVERSFATQLFAVSARTRSFETVVGMARVVGDGGLCFYVQDVIVHPDYQNRGIGTRLMQYVLEYIDRTGCTNSYVGLMAAKGKEGFYASFGFDRRPNEHLGAGMTVFWRSRV